MDADKETTDMLIREGICFSGAEARRLQMQVSDGQALNRVIDRIKKRMVEAKNIKDQLRD